MSEPTEAQIAEPTQLKAIWVTPQSTHIDMKRTLFNSGSGPDGVGEEAGGIPG